MPRERDVEMAMRWIRGTLDVKVAHRSVFLAGPIGEPGRVAWNVFACLYPRQPYYRLYTHEPVTVVQREMIREEVLGLTLPDRVSSRYSAVEAEQAWRVAAPVSGMLSVPMGMYVTGRYFGGRRRGSRPVSVLWHMASLPSAFVVERLKAAARG